MYLRISGINYPVTRRLVGSDTIKYLGVTPAPLNVTGMIQMYRDDGFLMSVDNADNFNRHVYSGTLFQITNKPEADASSFVPPEPPPEALVFNAIVG
jgi:hypothetical protein